MSDKNNEAQLNDAEAKKVNGGGDDGTSVTPPPSNTGIKLNLAPAPGVQLWETIGAPGVDGIPRG